MDLKVFAKNTDDGAVKLVDEVETIHFDFIDGAFLVPGVSLERIIGYFLGRINVTFES